jgi:hypothetical protein
VKRRSDPEQEADHARRPEAEEKDARPATDGADPWHVRWQERAEHASAPDGQQQTNSAAGEREQQAFGEQLADNATASGA